MEVSKTVLSTCLLSDLTHLDPPRTINLKDYSRVYYGHDTQTPGVNLLVTPTTLLPHDMLRVLVEESLPERMAFHDQYDTYSVSRVVYQM